MRDIDFARAYESFDFDRWKAEVEVRDAPQSAGAHAGLALLYAQMGWKGAALAQVDRALKLEPPADVFANHWFHFNLARAYTWAAEPDAALKQVKFLLNIPWDYKVNNFRLDPVWDPLRKDPRFQKLLETKKL